MHPGAPAPAIALERINADLGRNNADPAAISTQAEQLLLQWAAVKPEEAMRFALDDNHTHMVFLQAAGNVMEAWARRDPVAARTFFEGLDAMQAGLVAPSLLQGYGSQAPESALEWIHAGTTSDELRAVLARSVVGVYESAHRREEIKLWLSLPGVADSAHGTTAAADLARRIARGNPAAALAYCRELPPNSPARALALQEAVRQWASGDPEACRKWLNTRPSSAGQPGNFSDAEFDRAIAGFLTARPGTVPDATTLLASIHDESLRATLTKTLNLPR